MNMQRTLWTLAGVLNLSVAVAVAQSAPAPVDVVSMQTAVGYENRAAVGTRSEFTHEERIYVALELVNAGPPTEVRVSFERQGSATQPRGVALQVGTSRRFRTVARTAGLPVGSYRAVVRSADGAELQHVDFVVR